LLSSSVGSCSGVGSGSTTGAGAGVGSGVTLLFSASSTSTSPHSLAQVQNSQHLHIFKVRHLHLPLFFCFIKLFNCLIFIKFSYKKKALVNSQGDKQTRAKSDVYHSIYIIPFLD
jgi:hypothetical protein